MVTKKLGDLKFEVTQVNFSKLKVTLREVKHVPVLWVNVFSINKQLKNLFRFDDLITSY
jgi:hypothetical protein